MHSEAETFSGAAPLPAIVRSNVHLPGLKVGQSAAWEIETAHAISATSEKTRMNVRAREWLAYQEVWSTPLTQLCAKYGLSDNGLRKICRRLNVPVPPRGYWAKVEAGHRVQRTPLPVIAEWTTTEVWREPKREKAAADEVDVAWLKEREAYEADVAHAITLVLKPRRWHAAIAPLHELLEREAKEVEASRKAQQQYDKWPEWRKQRGSGPDRMAWQWYERAGQLMPATKRGFQVTYDSKKGRVVLVGHGEFELRMSEATEQKTRKVKRYDGQMEDERYRVPTGRLRILVERGYGKVWAFEESAESLLEATLDEQCTGDAADGELQHAAGGGEGTRRGEPGAEARAQRTHEHTGDGTHPHLTWPQEAGERAYNSTDDQRQDQVHVNVPAAAAGAFRAPRMDSAGWCVTARLQQCCRGSRHARRDAGRAAVMVS